MSTETAKLLPKRPTTPADLGEAIRAAAGASVQVRLSGSDSLPLTKFNTELAVQNISLLRMNKLVEHAISDMTVIVQAGMTLEALQKQLAWHNQWLPVDPPSYRGRMPGHRTIGGLIATNSLGPLRLGSGDWRLLIMGMSWIDATGTLIKGGGRTVKNVAGYSTPRLMIGSCGSLGAIAEVTLRTFARPADEQCVVFYCDSAKRAEELVGEIFLSPTTPAYAEAIGIATFAANPLGLPAGKRGVAIVVGFLDRPQSCVAQIEILRGIPEAKGLESISQTAAQAGRMRLWLTSEPIAEPTQGAGVRIHALSSQTCGLVADLEQAAAEAGGRAWAVSEAATGVVRAVIDAPRAAEMAQGVLKRHAGATMLFTQGNGGASTCTLNVDMTCRIKSQLDPATLFGNAAI
jgi:glycolate oxidase FAD binding subunit